MATQGALIGHPRRQNYGKEGRALSVITNFYEVTVRKSNTRVWTYAISFPQDSINDKPILKETRYKLMHLAQAQLAERGTPVVFAFDGAAVAFAYGQVPPYVPPEGGEIFEVRFADMRGDKSFKVKIECANTEDREFSTLMNFLNNPAENPPTPELYEVVRSLDISLSSDLSRRCSFLSNARPAVPIPNHYPTDLGGGLQVQFGSHANIRALQRGLLMNVDIKSLVSVKDQSMADFIGEIIKPQVSPLKFTFSRRDCLNVTKKLKGVKFYTEHSGRKMNFKAHALNETPAEKAMFEDKDGNNISVAEYFRRTYMPLRWPHWPCIAVKKGARVLQFPIEVCFIPVQSSVRKVDPTQAAMMIKATVLKPHERAKVLHEAVKVVDQCIADKDGVCQSFGLSFSQRPVEVKGRKRDPPTLTFGRHFNVQPNDTAREGGWNMRGKQFYKPGANLKLWLLLDFTRQRDDMLQQLAEKVEHWMTRTGVTVEERARIERYNGNNYSDEALETFLRTFRKAQLIVFLRSERDPVDVYAPMKRVLETKFGIHSQCMLVHKATKLKDDYFGNIAVKINTKLGGYPVSINGEFFARRRVMCFGVDVTHPTPGAMANIPSVATVVGACNKENTRYFAQVRYQERRAEVIVNMKECVKELLQGFRAQTNVAPDCLVFFRDGVGEGQFAEIMQREVQAVRQACYELSPNYKPAITYYVVSKRNHCRLVVKNDRGQLENPPSGLVVDTGIVHPFMHDFYLNSHKGLLGTSRPVHYAVLIDERRWTADELESMPYYLCHVSGRSGKTTCIPAPITYAHLLAFRHRKYLRGGMDSSDDASIISGMSADMDWSIPKRTEMHPDLTSYEMKAMFYV